MSAIQELSASPFTFCYIREAIMQKSFEKRSYPEVQADIASQSKLCAGACNQRLPFSMFCVYKASPDGRAARCFKCYREYNRRRYIVRRYVSLPIAAPLMATEEILAKSVPVPYSDPGLYFLIDEVTYTPPKVVYVGKEAVVGSRARVHSAQGKTRRSGWIFQRVCVIRCSVKELDGLEKAYIKLLRPKYNIQYNNDNQLDRLDVDILSDL